MQQKETATKRRNKLSSSSQVRFSKKKKQGEGRRENESGSFFPIIVSPPTSNWSEFLYSFPAKPPPPPHYQVIRKEGGKCCHYFLWRWLGEGVEGETEGAGPFGRWGRGRGRGWLAAAAERGRGRDFLGLQKHEGRRGFFVGGREGVKNRIKRRGEGRREERGNVSLSLSLSALV